MIEIKTEVVTTIKLSEAEVHYLRNLLQNPHGCTAENESPFIKDMRHTIFDALTQATNVINNQY